MNESKGEITVFLTLVTVIMLSFILAMVEGAVIQTSKNQGYLLADLALFSVFGEYQKELFEDYNVFALEGSYGRGIFDEEDILNRMRYYESTVTKHEVVDIQFLTDNQGQAFREQVLYFMEESYGLDIIRDLVNLNHNWEQQEIVGTEVAKEEEGVMEELYHQLVENETAMPEDNEISHIGELKDRPILSLVLPKGTSVSNLSISLEEQASRRSLQTGRGTFPANNTANSVEGKAFFCQYVLKTFNNVSSEMEGEDEDEIARSGDNNLKRNLKYEVEYILEGQGTDAKNLERIALKLIAIRMGINYVYLRSDSVKIAQVKSMAAAIAAAMLIPIATIIIEQALMLAWAFGESIMDLRALFAGKKVAILKSASTWQLSLTSLLTLGTKDDNLVGKDAENGIKYEDYLRIMLLASNYNSLTMRTLDRVEQNMIYENGKDYFKVDNCISKIRIYNKVLIRNDISYDFQLYFGYL